MINTQKTILIIVLIAASLYISGCASPAQGAPPEDASIASQGECTDCSDIFSTFPTVNIGGNQYLDLGQASFIFEKFAKDLLGEEKGSKMESKYQRYFSIEYGRLVGTLEFTLIQFTDKLGVSGKIGDTISESFVKALTPVLNEDQLRQIENDIKSRFVENGNKIKTTLNIEDLKFEIIDQNGNILIKREFKIDPDKGELLLLNFAPVEKFTSTNAPVGHEIISLKMWINGKESGGRFGGQGAYTTRDKAIEDIRKAYAENIEAYFKRLIDMFSRLKQCNR